MCNACDKWADIGPPDSVISVLYRSHFGICRVGLTVGSKTEWISIICNLMKEKPEPELWDLRKEAFGKLRTSLWAFIVSLYRSLSMQSHHHLHSVSPTLLLRTSSTKETMDLFLSLWSLPRSCSVFLSFSLRARQGNVVAGWRNRPSEKLFMDLRTTQ